MMNMYSRSVQSILEEINDFKTANLRDLGMDELQQRLSRFLDGHWYRTVGMKANPIFRARKYSDELHAEIGRLWYPPSECVTRYGRVNDVGQQIFYAADTEDTAILEIRPKVGDMIFVIRCELRDPNIEAHVIEIGLSERALQRNDVVQIDLFENTAEGRDHLLSNENIEKNSALRSFLVEQFTKIVEEGNEAEYKITLALAKLLMSRDRIDGMAYPSIASRIGPEFPVGTNLALKAEAVDRLYQVTGCHLIAILEQKGEFEFGAIEKMFAHPLPDRGLEWE